jgi:hypothetical protein
MEIFNGKHILNKNSVEVIKNPDLFWSFISRCIENEPSKRPSAEKCYKYLSLFSKIIDHIIFGSHKEYIGYSVEKKNSFFIICFEIVNEKLKGMFEF